MLNVQTMPTISNNEEAPARPAMWKGVDVLFISLGILVAMALGVAALVFGMGLADGDGSLRAQPLAFSVGIIAVQGIVMVLAVWLVGLLRRRYSWADIGLVKTTAGWVAASVGLFVVLRVVVTVLAMLMAQLGITSVQSQAIAPVGFSLPGAVGMLLFAGVLVPIAEEIFFAAWCIAGCATSGAWVWVSSSAASCLARHIWNPPQLFPPWCWAGCWRLCSNAANRCGRRSSFTS